MRGKRRVYRDENKRNWGGQPEMTTEVVQLHQEEGRWQQTLRITFFSLLFLLGQRFCDNQFTDQKHPAFLFIAMF